MQALWARKWEKFSIADPRVSIPHESSQTKPEQNAHDHASVRLRADTMPTEPMEPPATHPKPGPWDRLPWSSSYRPRGVSLARFQLASRTREFESAARGRLAPEIGRELAIDYARRTAYWRRNLPVVSSESPRPSGFSSPLGVADIVFWALLIPAWVVVLWLDNQSWLLWLIFAAIIALVFIRGRRQNLAASLMDAIEHRACPACGYDLNGSPDGIEPDLVLDTRTGPRVCPECGTPWPLLPPPAPGGPISGERARTTSDHAPPAPPA
jgi:hypothetical protein